MRQCEHPLRVLRFAPAGFLLGLSLLGLVGRPCLAETVTLQQGLTGYHGCVGTTLWEPKTRMPKDGPGEGILYLRGTVAYPDKYEVEVTDKKTGEKQKVQKTKYRESANRVLLKFDLPAALNGRKPARAKTLLARAEKLLKVPDEIVKDLRTWTWQPELLLAARRDLGETIDALSRLLSEAEILAVRRPRKQSELARQRAMLKRRAAAAREGESE